MPSGRITDILNGRRSITADTAVRLGRYFGNSAQFWLDLQGQYDIAVVEREKGARSPSACGRGCGVIGLELQRPACAVLLRFASRGLAISSLRAERPMTYQDIITIEPGKRGGRPCIRHMRIAVSDVLGWLAAGMTHAEILN